MQRRIAGGAVQVRERPDGSLSIARADVKLIKPREPAAGDGRKAVMLRPALERYAALLKAATTIAAQVPEELNRAAAPPA